MRAVIYSRYSTDLQNDRSIEDQVALCTAYAARHGYQVVGHYEDRAMSGASLHGRKVHDLLAAAERRQFDVVLTEAFDRLARDTADSLFVLKRLDFLGVKLVSVNQGEAETKSGWPPLRIPTCCRTDRPSGDRGGRGCCRSPHLRGVSGWTLFPDHSSWSQSGRGAATARSRMERFHNSRQLQARHRHPE